FPSSSHRGVAAESTAPEDLVDDEKYDDPARLDDQPVKRLRELDAAGEDRAGEIHLIEKGQVLRDAVNPFRKQIEGEDLAAEDGLNGHRENDEALNLEEPERQHAEAVGDAELDQRGKDQRREADCE